jgi:hypothetical protein
MRGLFVAVLTCLTLSAALLGCQKRNDDVKVVTPGPNRGADANTSQLPPDNASNQATAPQPPSPPPEPPNPLPASESWVYTPRLMNFIGQVLEIRYKLPAVDADAWIAMVPSDFAATDAVSNLDANRVEIKLVPAAEAAVNVPLMETGQFRLRLFDGPGADAKLLGETPPVTVTQWAMGDRARKQPPYVTIGKESTTDAPVEIGQGLPVIGYYEVSEGYPATAWIGVIPTRVVSPVSSDNDGSDVHFDKLTGPKGQSTWITDKQGTYVFRVFPSDAPGTDYVAESEPFTVVAAK